MTTDLQRERAAEVLRGMFPVGSRAVTIIKHVSRSGMTRTIAVLGTDDDGCPMDVSALVARVTDFRLDRDRGGLIVSGCGMDMGFHVVYELSRALYPDGHPCTGHRRTEKRANGRTVRCCPSNEHFNGDNEYRRGKKHSDGGYAIRQSWA